MQARSSGRGLMNGLIPAIKCNKGPIMFQFSDGKKEEAGNPADVIKVEIGKKLRRRSWNIHKFRSWPKREINRFGG